MPSSVVGFSQSVESVPQMRPSLVTWLGCAASTLWLVVGGCSTAVSTMQPASVLPQGKVHLGVGVDSNIPVSRAYSMLDAANDVATKYERNAAYQPTDQDRKDLMKAAAGLALNAPGGGVDVMARYGLLEQMDVGLRYTTTGVHGDVKWQFMGKGDGKSWDGSVSLGYSRQVFHGLIFDALDYLRINDFSRQNVEVPLLLGKRVGDWGFLWMGPKYVYSRYHVDATLQNLKLVDQTEGNIHYFGGLCGFGVGYKYLYLFGELTVMNMFARPVVLGQETDIGGIIVAPSGGLMARF